MSTNLFSTNPKPRRKNHPQLNENDAVRKLQETSLLIDKLGHFKDHQDKRAKEAISLLEVESNSKNNYQQFLLNLRRHVKPENWRPLVKLCAIALGKNAIKYARQHVLSNLPGMIGDLEDKLVNDVLEGKLQVPGQSCSHLSESSKQTYQEQIISPDGTCTSKANCRKSTNTIFLLETASQIMQGPPHHALVHDRESLPLEFQLRDLVDFLQEHEGLNTILQMNCPLSGHPLPSVFLGYQQSGHANAKLEFSQPLATTFIRYVMNRRQIIAPTVTF